MTDESGDDDSPAKAPLRRVTSSELSGKAVAACWALGAAMLGAGVAATFLRDNQAGTATLIVFGSILVILALMGRIPLQFEVGSAKLDASYEADLAFEAGREGGLIRGREVAIHEVRESVEKGEDTARALERLSEHNIARVMAFQPPLDGPRGAIGYRGPTACAAAAITHRQLDYWARTGFVTPSLRSPKYGHALYSRFDVVLLAVVKRLLNVDLSLTGIRPVVYRLRELRYEGALQVTILWDGQSIFEATTPEEVVDLISSARGVVALPISGIWNEVVTTLEDLPSEPAELGEWGGGGPE